MIKIIRKIIRHLLRTHSSVKAIALWVAEKECAISSFWTKSAHKRLMEVQWGVPPAPENFDHHIDQFYLWEQTRNPQWLERGIYGALAIKGGNLLELCCGDGFNAKYFYSINSQQVIACDFDPKIIRHAQSKNSAANVSFHVADIRTQMPDGQFDNIAWDGAIEHFTETEIQDIMVNIKNRLSTDGVLSGHTIVERSDGQKQLIHHEYEFKSKEDLLRFLTPIFSNVIVFETV